MMDAIGGYMSFDNMPGNHYHDTPFRFNSGRSALRFLINERGYRHIYLPLYMCDCVELLLKSIGTSYSFFPVGSDLLPNLELQTKSDEAVFIVNYFGSLSYEDICGLKRKYGNIILDNTQAFFVKPVPNIDTIYTARKFFGTSDGAYLFSDVSGSFYDSLPEDKSAEYTEYLFGRIEKGAEEYYTAFRKNEERLDNPECRRMSASTDTLLRVMDYNSAIKKRKENFSQLDACLSAINMLETVGYNGYFMYPLLVENGARLRAELIKRKIFIPCLWRNVLEHCPETSFEWNMAANCVMLPIDQRYGSREMEYICSQIREISQEDK